MTGLRGLLAASHDIEVRWIAADDLRRSYWVCVVLAAALGVALLAGADARISSDGFAVIRQTGGRALWGAAFCGGALLMLAARAWSTWLLQWALRAQAVIYLLWAMSIGEAVLHSPTAAFTGPVVYVAVAAVHLSDAESYRRRKP